MADPSREDRDLVEEVCAGLGLTGASVAVLEGGTRNRSYRLADGRQDVVLRVAGEHDASYAVAREAEYAAQDLAAAHGLAPRLLLTAPGHSVTEFVPGATWSRERAASADGASQAGAWLARLHAIPVPVGLRRVCFLASLEAYASQLQDRAPVQRMVESARVVARELGEFAPALCHNDLHHLNLIDSPGGLVAIDWEYAGAGDPRLDLAGYVAYHDLPEPAVKALLDAHAARRPRCSRGDLVRARWLFEAVWWAWLELRLQLEGDEPEAMSAVRSRLLGRLRSSRSWPPADGSQEGRSRNHTR